MDKSITERGVKSIAQEELRQVLLITRLLEDAGIRVLGASTNCGDLPPSVLISGNFGTFREWAKNKMLEVKFTRMESNQMPWMIWTEYRGVEIHTFLSNVEKERYFDGAEET